MGSGGFEPSKAEPTDLQSAPFDRSGNSPKINLERKTKLPFLNNAALPHKLPSRLPELNRRPHDYKSSALPAELRRR